MPHSDPALLAAYPLSPTFGSARLRSFRVAEAAQAQHACTKSALSHSQSACARDPNGAGGEDVPDVLGE